MQPRYAKIGYRRNGKQQACEPCRKGKLVCDHASPFCGRCTRRKITSRCIYHPAPMTKSRTTSEPSQLPSHVPSVPADPLTRQQYSSQRTGGIYSLFRPGLSSASQNPSSTEQLAQEPQARQPHFAPNARHDTQGVSPDTGQSTEETLRLTAFHGDWKKDAHYRRSTRYYGATSFSAVFSEHQGKLNEDLLDLGENSRKHPATWPLSVFPLLSHSFIS